MCLQCTTAFALYPISWLAPEGAVAVAVWYFVSLTLVSPALLSRTLASHTMPSTTLPSPTLAPPTTATTHYGLPHLPDPSRTACRNWTTTEVYEDFLMQCYTLFELFFSRLTLIFWGVECGRPFHAAMS